MGFLKKQNRFFVFLLIFNLAVCLLSASFMAFASNAIDTVNTDKNNNSDSDIKALTNRSNTKIAKKNYIKTNNIDKQNKKTGYASSFFYFVLNNSNSNNQNVSAISFSSFLDKLKNTTSIEIKNTVKFVNKNNLSKILYDHMYLFALDDRNLINSDGSLKIELVLWLLSGGTLILQSSAKNIDQFLPLTKHPYFKSYDKKDKNKLSFAQGIDINANLSTKAFGIWQAVSLDHALFRSFYLIKTLPDCNQHNWYEFYFDQRTMIVIVPDGFITSVSDQFSKLSSNNCLLNNQNNNKNKYSRSFVNLNIKAMINLIMVLLTDDYKKDQIHASEILKKLR